MLSKIIRIGLSVILFALGVYLITEREIGNGIMVILLGAVVLFTFFRNEMILLAFWHLRKQNFEKTEKFLGYIKNPDKSLIKSQQAYYAYLMGLVNSQKQTGKAMGEAEKNFKKALNIGLNMDHDKAMANLQLAALVMAKGRKQEAQKLLTAAKKLDKSKMLTDQIKMLQGQMKMPVQKNMDHFRMGGGKGRRR
ncbi:MAG: DUF2892 domain-containing protein [Bacteroidota bacterium]